MGVAKITLRPFLRADESGRQAFPGLAVDYRRPVGNPSGLLHRLGGAYRDVLLPLSSIAKGLGGFQSKANIFTKNATTPSDPPVQQGWKPCEGATDAGRRLPAKDMNDEHI